MPWAGRATGIGSNQGSTRVQHDAVITFVHGSVIAALSTSRLKLPDRGCAQYLGFTATVGPMKLPHYFRVVQLPILELNCGLDVLRLGDVSLDCL
jgi:hypothetical protein